MKRYKLLTIWVLFLCLMTFSACESAQEHKFDAVFEHLTTNYGGQTVTYAPKTDFEMPTVLFSLYSRGKTPPDEFNMIEKTYLWYGESVKGGDVAVFKLFNATDAGSVKKMCDRREKTLKYSAGIKSTTVIDGHYVIFINGGDFAGLTEEVCNLLGGSDYKFYKAHF